MQNEALERLSVEGGGTQIVTRMLDVLKQNPERASLYKQFIETRIEPAPDAAPDDEQGA